MYDIDIEEIKFNRQIDYVEDLISEFNDLCNIKYQCNINKGFSKDAKFILENHPVTVYHNVNIPTYIDVLNNNVALEKFNTDIDVGIESLLRSIWNGISSAVRWIIHQIEKLFGVKDNELNDHMDELKRINEDFNQHVNLIQEELNKKIKELEEKHPEMFSTESIKIDSSIDIDKISDSNLIGICTSISKKIFKGYSDKAIKKVSDTIFKSIKANKAENYFIGLDRNALNKINSSSIKDIKIAINDCNNKLDFISEYIKNDNPTPEELDKFKDLYKNEKSRITKAFNIVKLTKVSIENFTNDDYNKSLNILSEYTKEILQNKNVLDLSDSVKNIFGEINRLMKNYKEVKDTVKNNSYTQTVLNKYMDDLKYIQKVLIYNKRCITCIKRHCENMPIPKI